MAGLFIAAAGQKKGPAFLPVWLSVFFTVLDARPDGLWLAVGAAGSAAAASAAPLITGHQPGGPFGGR